MSKETIVRPSGSVSGSASWLRHRATKRPARVSTEHGLDQEFNSLDAQYDAASAYIRSQAHAGWALIRSRYDDGGYSGGSTDRPDLQRLLDDIRARKIALPAALHPPPPRTAPQRCAQGLLAAADWRDGGSPPSWRGEHHQGNVAMPPMPGSALVVIEPVVTRLRVRRPSRLVRL
jgi:hypothetical protein